MKLNYKFLLASAILLMISACNSNVERFSVLQKCTVLGDESIVYARGYYVKLFYHFNPNKFSDSYKQIGDFDAITHKNTINTYNRAIDKLASTQQDVISDDITTQNLLSACTKLSAFSKKFVEEDYPLALIHTSKNDPLTDAFFIEINKIVKFDHDIGAFDESEVSFKQTVDSYHEAVNSYVDRFQKDIPAKFIKQRNSL